MEKEKRKREFIWGGVHSYLVLLAIYLGITPGETLEILSGIVGLQSWVGHVHSKHPIHCTVDLDQERAYSFLF